MKRDTLASNRLLPGKNGGDNNGLEYTSGEILGQPELWMKLWKLVRERANDISGFLTEAKSGSKPHIILTGAGSSAFIGEVLEGQFQKMTRLITKAVATTDLVTHPELYFQEDKDVLLISFARSGNSPESIKAVELAEALCRRVFNLIVTCNGDGRLAGAAGDTRHLTFVLPQEADDKSLAMTGSFTSMLLAGLLISDIDYVREREAEVSLLSKYAQRIFDDYIGPLNDVSQLEFERALFLGSGMMKGVARESHLKLQELTDGKVICKYDSFLGVRHGPMAIINEQTLIAYLFTNNKYASLYDADLVKGIGQGRRPLFSVGIMEDEIPGVDVDLKMILGDGKTRLREEFLPVVSVLPAQILGFLKSVQLGLKPDNPSESGMIHRVVQGVNLYPYMGNADN